MSHAEVCPVCEGTGKVKEYNKYFSPFGFEHSTGLSYIEKTCHGCQGKGWVNVTDINDIYKYDYTKRGKMDINTDFNK